MAETRNIVILGAQAAGLSAAHYTVRHILPKLQQARDVKYMIHLVDPSTHLWWHIAAPREIVSVKQMKHSDYFIPIRDGFKQYSYAKDSIEFHQATAKSLDVDRRTVEILTNDGEQQVLPYYALVVATGMRSPTPLTTLHGDHTVSQRALEEMNVKLSTAKEVVIGGGGPVGVEIAGEIAAAYKDKTKVTLITSSDKLIPVFKPQRAHKVQKRLDKLGVKVMYNTKITEAAEGADSKTVVQLDNGTILTPDVYIPAMGVIPNTEFLPANLRKEKDYAAANPKTLRIDAAGPRVYAVGDVAGVDLGGMLKLLDTLPVFGANFAHDLLADANLGIVPEKSYERKDSETQLVPVGPKGGVGAFNGHTLPSFLVVTVKGKDYMKARIAPITEGTNWKKP